jgi:hypothetical protein
MGNLPFDRERCITHRRSCRYPNTLGSPAAVAPLLARLHGLPGHHSSVFPANVKARIRYVCEIAVRMLRGTLECRIEEAEIIVKIASDAAAYYYCDRQASPRCCQSPSGCFATVNHSHRQAAPLQEVGAAPVPWQGVLQMVQQVKAPPKLVWRASVHLSMNDGTTACCGKARKNCKPLACSTLHIMGGSDYRHSLLEEAGKSNHIPH